MKKFMIFSIVVLFLSMLALQGLSRAEDKTDNGKDLYNNNCKVCHGVNGDGKGPAAVAFNPAPTAFVQQEFWKKDTRGLITDSILHGRGKMPAANLSPQEIKAIIDYMTHAYKK